MPTITITIPDDLLRLAKSRATAAGCADVGEYLTALLVGAVGLPLSREVEDALLQGMDSQPRELSAAEWDEKRRRRVHLQGPRS